VSVSPPTPIPVVVIGGGISGLACAYRLQQAGIGVRLLDAGDRPGGLIATVEKDGFRFELGPQSFLSTGPLLGLIESLGLKEQLLRADPRAPRYILLRGQLVPAPLAPPALLTTPLFSLRTKWRIFTEIFRRTKPPATDESIAAFVRRKFGDELLDRLVAPFVSGIYAGDPEKLSVGAAFPQIREWEAKYGSVLRGAMKSRPAKGTPRPGLCTFRAGMEALPRALAARLGEVYHPQTTVTGLSRGKTNGKSWFELQVTRQDQRETLAASAVVIATPPNAAAEIVKGLAAQIAEPFLQIKYASVAVVAAGYRREQVRRAANGFGFLVPRGEGLRVLGTVWNSSLFPGHAPEGMSCFTSFAGGALDPGLCGLGEEEIAKVVCREVESVLDISGPPVTRFVQRYARALPQYNLGHAELISGLNRRISAVPGLFLTGNYLSGPSIGACVEQAGQIADRVRAYLAIIGLANAGAVAHA
jgi:oxygen-dependent protoporphyrinogen oxidase